MRTILACTTDAAPSICSSAIWPSLIWAESAAARLASSSSRLMSTSSSTRPSMPMRSPFWARRWEIWPLMGERSTVSSNCLRITSTPANAALWLAWALARLALDESSAYFEIKPFSTRVPLLSKVRCAMSSCALADSACCCAWRSRAWESVASTRATTWPALTRSPSRRFRPCNSPATRALMKAELVALIVPEMARRWVSSRVCTCTRSAATSSITDSTLAAACSACCCWALRWPTMRMAPKARPAMSKKGISHFKARRTDVLFMVQVGQEWR